MTDKPSANRLMNQDDPLSVTGFYESLFGESLSSPGTAPSALTPSDVPAFVMPVNGVIGMMFSHDRNYQECDYDRLVFTGEQGASYGGACPRDTFPGDDEPHRGHDYWAPANTELVAVLGGHLFRRPRGSTLSAEIVTDINGDGYRDFKVRYDHLNEYRGTGEGELIMTRDPVGVIGNSGTQSIHLHFETLYYGGADSSPYCSQCNAGMLDPYGWWVAGNDQAPGNLTPGNTWLWQASDTSDDADHSFQRFDYEEGWLRANPAAGYAGGSWYTSDSSKWAVWGLRAVGSGDYAVQVYLPAIAGVVYPSNATYTIYRNTKNSGDWVATHYDCVLDQQANSGRWASLSCPEQIHLDQDEVILLRLKVPQNAAGTSTVFDAVRLLRIGDFDTNPLADYQSPIIRPIDPNEKAGPAGYGETHIIAAGEKLGYTVYFENMPAATAPVQELVVEDVLDPNLDWATLELGEVAYGGRIVEAPPGALEFTAQDFPGVADIAGTFQGQARVDVTAALDPDAGKITWTMKVIDTATGLFPEDAAAGFLPPENGTGRGQGHVTFTIRPKPGVADGTRIINRAGIVFDTNDPIATNEVSNTIGSVLADLALVNAASPDPAEVGGELTYKLTVTNRGPLAAAGVVVTDTLPAGITYLATEASQGSCSGTANVQCNLGTLENEGTATVTIRVRPTAAGTLENVAGVSSSTPDPRLNDNTALVRSTVVSVGPVQRKLFLPLVLRNP